MSDPRLLRWLEAGQRVLALAAEEQVAALSALCAEREALAAEPPRERIPGELVARLEALEAALACAVRERRDERAARIAVSGYAPASLDVPAFVSRSV